MILGPFSMSQLYPNQMELQKCNNTFLIMYTAKEVDVKCVHLATKCSADYPDASLI